MQARLAPALVIALLLTLPVFTVVPGETTARARATTAAVSDLKRQQCRNVV